MLSELHVVNSMLSAIGSAPVNTIAGSVSADVAIAKQVLEEVRLDVLLQGWSFNTDRNVRVAPQANGRIKVPSDTLRLDVSPDHYTQADPVQRGEWLYDRKENSYTFASGMEVDIIRDLPWDHLPEVARRYIGARAARVFVARNDGDEKSQRFAMQDEMAALTTMTQNESDTGDYTIFDNATAQDILYRGR